MDKKMFTLYVGDIDSTLADNAKSRSQDAYLIEQSNWNQKHQGVAYTSLSDVPSENELAFLFRQADKIIYSPPPNNQWSDGKNSMQKQFTEYYLEAFAKVKNKEVINFNTSINNDIYVKPVDERKIQDKQLWCAGCSITVGYGVKKDQRYSNLISKTLNLPVSMIAESGSSILWSSEQIIKSDIRQGDILVWGITSPDRFTYYDKEKGKRYHVNTGTYDILKNQLPDLESRLPKSFLTDFTLTFVAVNQIQQVVNLCRKNGIKLVLAGVIPGVELSSYLYHLPEYIHLEGQFGLCGDTMFIDTGFDNQHPGPEMHQWYADQIYKKILEIT